MEQYQESFDSLLTRVDLPMSHAVSFFLSGLNEEIQHAVRMFKPDALHDSYCLVKLQEATLASIAKRTKPILDKTLAYTRGTGGRYGSTSQTWKPTSQRLGFSTKGNTSVSSIASSTSKPRTAGRTMSSKEIEERRANNLCFFCDEKYFSGHKCSAQVYRLEILEEENSNDMEGEQEEA